MIRTTRWYPDTCDCIVEYQWDDDVPEAEREHRISRMVAQCAEHPGDDLMAVFAAIVATNKAAASA